jgi:MFS transporter, PHS family, inorganic phosphate transporter
MVVTFSLLSVSFVVCGGTLIALSNARKSHLVTGVFYAILQFLFNLGPNTLIFVIAVEIFHTVYRGTFYGIAAACGKIGAMVIRAIIGATGNQETSLGTRLLVFIPFMILAAVLSWFLPKVQEEDEKRCGHPEVGT